MGKLKAIIFPDTPAVFLVLAVISFLSMVLCALVTSSEVAIEFSGAVGIALYTFFYGQYAE